MLLRDSAVYLAAKILPAAAGLLAVLLLLRLAGAAEYGQFALTVATGTMIGSFAGGWINQAILRFLPSSDSVSLALERSAIRKATLISTGALVSIAVLAGAVFPLLTGSPWRWMQSVACLAVGCSLMIFNVRLALHQAALQPVAVACRQALRALLSIALPTGIALILLPNVPYWALAFAFSAAYLLGAAARSAGASTTEHSSAASPLRNELFHYWKFGWPVSAWLGVMAAFPVVDRYLIGLLMSHEQVGIYAAIYDLLVRGLGLLFAPVVLAVHPRIMKLADRGAAGESRKVLLQAVGLQIAIFIPTLVAFVWALPPLLKYVLPSESMAQAAVPLIVPLATGAFAWQLALLLHKPLEVRMRTAVMLGFLAVALAVHTSAAILLIPRFQLLAAAYSTVLSSAVYILLCLSYSYLQRARPVSGKTPSPALNDSTG
jgi:O-antigen/teichoic acid export membrane protein